MKTYFKLMLTLIVLGSAAPLSAQEKWTVTPALGPVSEHVMVRDAKNDRLILFGGYINGVLSNETWSYDPVKEAWQPLEVAGIAPSPRREALGAYDSRRGRMILFGGKSSTGNTNDTFALNLKPGAERWEQIAQGNRVAPPVRTHGTLIIDEANDRAILYGGYASPVVYRDVWALSLEEGFESWGDGELATISNPNGTSIGNAAIYDPVGQRMLVFRSYTRQLVALALDDTLTWTHHTNASMPTELGRYPAAAYDSARNEMILHGGLASSETYSEAWRVDLGTMEFSQLPSEPDSTGRFWHTAAYDDVRDLFVIVGGRDYPRYAHDTMAALGLLPGTPEGLTPNDEGDRSQEGVLRDEKVVLRWNESVGIRDGRYIVEVYRFDGRSLVLQHSESVSGNKTVFVPGKVEDANEEASSYAWRVTAVNYNGHSDSSELATFRHMHEDVLLPEDGEGETVKPADELDSANKIKLPADGDSESVQQPSTTIVGGGSASTSNPAGCTSGAGGPGLALAILLLGIAGVTARRLKRA